KYRCSLSRRLYCGRRLAPTLRFPHIFRPSPCLFVAPLALGGLSARTPIAAPLPSLLTSQGTLQAHPCAALVGPSLAPLRPCLVNRDDRGLASGFGVTHQRVFPERSTDSR